MKYKAVIFDLFGTLVKKLSVRESRGHYQQMASVLSVSYNDFIKIWRDSHDERGLGIFQSIEDNIEYICQKLGANAKEAQIKLAAQIDFKFKLRSIRAQPEAMEVLSTLKSHGYPTGLISDCSSDIPIIWRHMPLSPLIDAAVFSCLVGLQKPDPRIYWLATERLMVNPENCLYIGDGDSRELTGASQAGMRPVLIRVADEDSTDVFRVNAEADEWDGPVILSLREVLTLVG